jgi:hypothetical protein
VAVIMLLATVAAVACWRPRVAPQPWIRQIRCARSEI